MTNLTAQTKLGLIGSNGKMGQAILQATDPQSIVKVDRNTNLESYIEKADVWMDFSLNELAIKHINLCQKYNKPILIGTTGEITKLDFQPTCPVMFAPNCSITWNLIRKLLKNLTGHQLIITDTHNHTKLDTPSGTTKDIVAFMPQVVGIHSIRNNINGAKMQLSLFNFEEIIDISYQALGRDSYAKGAIFASIWLAKQPAGLYSMESCIQELLDC